MTVWFWLAIPPVGSQPSGSYAWTLQDARDSSAAGSDAENLRDREVNVAWGFFAGHALMVALTAIMALAVPWSHSRVRVGGET